MAQRLMIVESPAKAKTIEGYLAKGFLVKSSFGHIRDLPKKGLAIDIANDFAPTYAPLADKEKIIKELKAAAAKASSIYLATDEDREGEAISWHLFESLALSSKNTKRVVFREITKKAIEQALLHPRDLDMHLVNAQQARRVLDRLVGFEISPILWKKIKRGLSAGRVQSVAVRLIVEQERSIENFKQSTFFQVKGILQGESGADIPVYYSKKLSDSSEAESFLLTCHASLLTVRSIEKKASLRHPSAPFSTSTLQQEASQRLGFSVNATMQLAQRLYEHGKISYMRTDSFHLSDEALAGAASVIQAEYGASYVKTRQYATRAKQAQEAHEAIRPTNFRQKTASKDAREQKLYALIWQRAMASQMAAARISRTIVHISIGNQSAELTATGEVIEFDGFLRLYGDVQHEEDKAHENNILPDVREGERLTIKELIAMERFSRPPARYGEAALVKKLEEMGIGRPSTYAPIIHTIQKREYAQKESREGTSRAYQVLTLGTKGNVQKETKTEIAGAQKNKLFPTDMGMVVNDFLTEHFSNIVDYSFTAAVEDELDKISEGKKAWTEMIRHFYDRFHPQVEASAQLERSNIAPARALGQDPDTNATIYVKMGRFGAYVQLGEDQPDKKVPSASLLPHQMMQRITLDEAIALLKANRSLGVHEGEDIRVAIGRYGPYIRHGQTFYSIPKDQDHHSFDLKRAIDWIEKERARKEKQIIKSFDENKDVVILEGRYGPYIRFGKKNIRIPKEQAPEALTYADCVALEKNAPARRARKKARQDKKA